WHGHGAVSDANDDGSHGSRKSGMSLALIRTSERRYEDYCSRYTESDYSMASLVTRPHNFPYPASSPRLPYRRRFHNPHAAKTCTPYSNTCGLTTFSDIFLTPKTGRLARADVRRAWLWRLPWLRAAVTTTTAT